MRTDVARLAGLAAGATMLSLFSTIIAIASVQASTLRWDGTFCTARYCPAPVFAAGAKHRQAAPQPVGSGRA